MPKKDGTGPEGKGSKKGRGLGNCVTEKTKEENNLGRGLGNRKGRGNRHRNNKK